MRRFDRGETKARSSTVVQGPPHPGGVRVPLLPRSSSNRQFLDQLLLTGPHGGYGAYGPGSGEWRVPQALADSGVGDVVFSGFPNLAFFPPFS